MNNILPLFLHGYDDDMEYSLAYVFDSGECRIVFTIFGYSKVVGLYEYGETCYVPTLDV